MEFQHPESFLDLITSSVLKLATSVLTKIKDQIINQRGTYTISKIVNVDKASPIKLVISETLKKDLIPQDKNATKQHLYGFQKLIVPRKVTISTSET